MPEKYVFFLEKCYSQVVLRIASCGKETTAFPIFQHIPWESFHNVS